MKKTFLSFDLGIDHLFPSEPKEKKQKKEEEQQRFPCLDVSKLDELVEGAQAKTTKYATECTVNVSQGNFSHLITTIKFSKSYSMLLKKMNIKIKRELYATDCECFELKFYTADRLSCFGCQMFKN